MMATRRVRPDVHLSPFRAHYLRLCEIERHAAGLADPSIEPITWGPVVGFVTGLLLVTVLTVWAALTLVLA
jgi:hypothetical protein